MINDWEKELILELFGRYRDWSIILEHSGDGKGLKLYLRNGRAGVNLDFYGNWVRVYNSFKGKSIDYVPDKIGDLDGLLNRPRLKLGSRVLKLLSDVFSSPDPVRFELIEYGFIYLNDSEIKLHKSLADFVQFGGVGV